MGVRLTKGLLVVGQVVDQIFIPLLPLLFVDGCISQPTDNSNGIRVRPLKERRKYEIVAFPNTYEHVIPVGKEAKVAPHGDEGAPHLEDHKNESESNQSLHIVNIEHQPGRLDPPNRRSALTPAEDARVP